MTPTHAMILAAGLGKRMRPLTDTCPKPMIKIAGQPLIDWALARLHGARVAHAVVNLHYLGRHIEAHLKNRTAPQITFSPEDPLLETGGGIENALAHLAPQPFFVCNSDGLWLDGEQNALTRLAHMWDDERMDGVLLLHDPARALGYDGDGDFCVENDGRLCRRRAASEVPAYVFTGVQLLHPRLFEGAPGGAYSLNILYDRALARGRLFGVVHDGEWFHVGTPAARDQTEQWLLTHDIKGPPP